MKWLECIILCIARFDNIDKYALLPVLKLAEMPNLTNFVLSDDCNETDVRYVARHQIRRKFEDHNFEMDDEDFYLRFEREVKDINAPVIPQEKRPKRSNDELWKLVKQGLGYAL